MKNMKKVFLTFCMAIIGCLALAETVQAFCLVSSESDSSINIYSLRYKITKNYNDKGIEATCTTGSTDSYDEALGFEQAILFATLEWGFSNDVNTITLNSPLSLDNPDENIVIGNFSQEEPEADSYAWEYPTDVVPVVDDYGVVTIDAKTNFDPDEYPFSCAAYTAQVCLRNVAINTNGITKDELFSGAPCLCDAGSVHVCGGTIDESKQTGAFGWCGPAG